MIVITRPLKVLILLMILALLWGCAQNPQPLGKPLPQLTFTHLTPLKIKGGAVQVKQNAEINAATYQTMNHMVLKADQLLMNYAQNRFVNSDKSPQLPVRAVYDLKSLTVTKKAEEDNILGILSGAAVEHYTLEAFITLSLVGRKGKLNTPYTIKLKRELLIPDRSSLAQTEMMQFEFLEKVINDIDKTIHKFIAEINS